MVLCCVFQLEAFLNFIYMLICDFPCAETKLQDMPRDEFTAEAFFTGFTEGWAAAGGVENVGGCPVPEPHFDEVEYLIDQVSKGFCAKTRQSVRIPCAANTLLCCVTVTFVGVYTRFCPRPSTASLHCLFTLGRRLGKVIPEGALGRSYLDVFVVDSEGMHV